MAELMQAAVRSLRRASGARKALGALRHGPAPLTPEAGEEALAEAVVGHGDPPKFPKGYEQDGCEVAPTCLACPLPMCRYEVKGGLRAIMNLGRNAEIVERRKSGEKPDELAGDFGVSRRTVFRVLAASESTPAAEAGGAGSPPPGSAVGVGVGAG